LEEELAQLQLEEGLFDWASKIYRFLTSYKDKVLQAAKAGASSSSERDRQLREIFRSFEQEERRTGKKILPRSQKEAESIFPWSYDQVVRVLDKFVRKLLLPVWGESVPIDITVIDAFFIAAAWVAALHGFWWVAAGFYAVRLSSMFMKYLIKTFFNA
jgi:hypothetical protein